MAVSKNGVASLAYGAGHPDKFARCPSKRDGRDKPGHDELDQTKLSAR
jgi:hypothetical protein